ncbi:hypothetical protein K461DRAFT_269104 [Myriangium duriaei CBS 260.36]|uniref:Uncharacterized protein n=1 Tax=Myriangium duriaei CBS 260.36 TaxID=1168546 RepID=A0A9P4J0V6_9PEZI|nr:hypothetical protein K461DRAFT_269104 [Myriangium duriaei CBS 260.36]
MPGRKTPKKNPAEATPTEKSASIKLRLKRSSGSSLVGESSSVEPPAKKTRLTTASSDEDQIAPNGVRPKRHAGKPKRYSDDSAAPTVDSFHKDSPPIKLRLSFSPKNSAPASPLLNDDGGLVPGGYDEAFLNHYIDTGCVGNGVPKTPVAAPPISSPRQRTSGRPTTVLPLPANPYATPTAAVNHRLIRQEDEELIMLKKLTRAISVLLTAHAQEENSRTQSRLTTHKSVHRVPNDGRLDVDLRRTIEMLIGILGWFSGNKSNHLNGARPQSGPSVDHETLRAQLDLIYQAITALEEIHDSAAIYINRIMPGEDRKYQIMEFYNALHILTDRMMHLQSSPHEINIPLLDIIFLEPETAANKTSSLAIKKPRSSYGKDTLQAAAADAAIHQRNGAQGPPPPHQFLRRELAEHEAMPPPRVPASKMRTAQRTN